MFKKKLFSRMNENGGSMSAERINFCGDVDDVFGLAFVVNFESEVPYKSVSTVASRKTHLTKMATERKTTRSPRNEATRICDDLPEKTF